MNDYVAPLPRSLEGIHVPDLIKPFREFADVEAEVSKFSLLTEIQLGSVRVGEVWRHLFRAKELSYDVLLDGEYYSYDHALMSLFVREKDFLNAKTEFGQSMHDEV